MVIVKMVKMMNCHAMVCTEIVCTGLLKITVCLHVCVCSPDGAGWVAGIRKELLAADDDEKSGVSMDDNLENMVSQRCFRLNLC